MTEIEREYDGAKQVISTYTYDSLNRVTQKVTDYIGFLLGDYITDYTYCDITNTQKTTRIASETCQFDKKELGKFEYTYYPNGNVSTVKKDGVLIREYKYDQYDRLTWEKNYTTNFEYSYVYDSNGNLTKKSQATKSSNNSTTSEITFIYGYSGDKIVSITTTFSDIPGVSSSQNFTYDELGNPTKYKDKTLTWQGRKLMSVGDTAMQYDYNGMRTCKGERYYYWLGNTLKMERWGENTIYYYYDESGISGFRYDDKEYYYHKNIFGDVVAIYDKDEDLQATYEYDAWGNHTVTNATDDNIGDINPIRYRSYYWDSELSLYYLQSRYYDPALGRFISPDSVEYLDPSSINGLNLYSYCGNDPVMYVDHSGHFLDAIFDALFIVWGISDLINGGYKDWKNWVALGIDVVFAVLPFVPAGIGQTIKAGDNALNLLSTINRFDNLYDLSKVTIVGETMSRVGWIANGYNATNNIYGGFQAYNRMANMGKVGKIGAEVFGKIHNANWLMKKLRTGYNVIDIGLDMFKAERSSSYMMERIILNIWETRNIWKFSLNYWL